MAEAAPTHLVALLWAVATCRQPSDLTSSQNQLCVSGQVLAAVGMTQIHLTLPLESTGQTSLRLYTMATPPVSPMDHARPL